MNFKTKGLVVEWKLAARKSFENFSYVGVPSIPVSFTFVSPLVWEYKSKPMWIISNFWKTNKGEMQLKWNELHNFNRKCVFCLKLKWMFSKTFYWWFKCF